MKVLIEDTAIRTAKNELAAAKRQEDDSTRRLAEARSTAKRDQDYAAGIESTLRTLGLL